MRREVFVTLLANSKPFEDGMRRAAKAMARIVQQAEAFLTHAATCQGPRCRTCHPLANPVPLPIDGRAYARKRAHR